MTRDTTIGARVPLDLREELEALRDKFRAEGLRYPDGREVDLSYIIRRACRTYVDARGQLPAGTGAPGLSSLDAKPPAHTRNGTETEAMAAAHAWPRANTGRRKVLRELALRGGRGMTSDEAVQVCGYSAQRRLHDLKAGGWAEVLRYEHDGTPVRRKTRRGAWADVYVLTPAARAELEAERSARGNA